MTKDVTEHKVLTIVFGAWVLLAICLQTYGVFSRNVLTMSTSWVDDVQRFNFIWLIWICGALTYGGRGLVSLDLLLSRLTGRPRAHHGVRVALTLVEIVFASVFAWLSVKLVSFQFGTGESTTALSIPLAILNLGFAIGCVLLLAFSLRKVVRNVRDLVRATPVQAEALDDVIAKSN